MCGNQFQLEDNDDEDSTSISVTNS
jgi:hypothetical protein